MKPSFSPFPLLETERLCLRELALTDLQEIFLIRSDPAMNKFIERPLQTNLQEAEAFILQIQKNIQEERSLYWAITIKGYPKLIGTICLWNFSNQDTQAELGYELITLYQGQGFLREAMQSVIHYGFSQLLLHRIEAYTHRDNARSIHLLKKNGFTQEWDAIDVDHQSNYIFSITNPVYKTF